MGPVGEVASRGCMYKKCPDEAQGRSKMEQMEQRISGPNSSQPCCVCTRREAWGGKGLHVQTGLGRRNKEIAASAAAASWLASLSLRRPEKDTQRS